MSVLEVLLLKVKSHLSHSDPALLAALREARTGLKERVIDTQSRFYQSISDPSLIFIFGIWPSVARHHEFLASHEKSAILDNQEELFDFKWALHIPINSMVDLPLAAPVVFLEAFVAREDGREKLRTAWEEHRTVIREKTRLFPALGGERVEEQGRWDFLVISGLEYEGEHEEFAAVRESCEEWEAYHLRDMEKKP